MVTSTSLASPPSPSRALHSGVSVLEHLGDADMNNNNNNNNISIGTAAMSEEAPSPSNTTSILTNNNNTTPPSQLGGSIPTPAYALLVGIALENESKMLSIPLTSLPTTFGKEHETKDVNFVGLTEYNHSEAAAEQGAASSSSSSNKSGPKLSKSMCSIYYRDGDQGGKLGCYKKKKKAAAAAAVNKDGGDNANKKNTPAAAAVDEPTMSITGDVDALNGMTYVPYETPSQDENDKIGATAAAEVTTPNDDIIRPPSMQQSDPLPSSSSNGFYAVECTGRKIIVGGKVLKKGQHAMLTNGITLQIASHCFYFLLPKKTNDDDEKSIKVTMTKTVVKVVDGGSTKKKKKKRDNDNNSDNDDDDTTSEDDDSSTLITTPRPTKKSKSTTTTAADNNDFSSTFASTLESKTDTQLLQMLSQATESNGWDKHSQNIGTTLATRACRAAANSTKLQKLNRECTGVTQRDVMNWINKDSDMFGEYEKMMLRKIEPKSFGIAMGKAIIRAGYTKSDVKSGRANRWMLPSDVIVPAVATVAPLSMKKSPSAVQMMKALPTGGGSGGGGGGNKTPPKPMMMVLPKASSVKGEMEKEQEMKESLPMKINNNDNNNGGGNGSEGGAVDVAAKDESNKNTVLPSQEDLKTFVDAWLARSENVQVSSTLLPSAKEKEEIMKGCGVDKKRLEGYFYRMRKKLKQKVEAEGSVAAAAASASDGPTAAGDSAPAVAAAAMPSAVPPTNATTVPPPTTAVPPTIPITTAPATTPTTTVPPTPTITTTAAAGTDPTTTIMTQQERENIAASRASNEAIQSGSPFKVATGEASVAAVAACAATQNVPAATITAATVSHVGTMSTQENVSAEKMQE